MRRRTVLVVLAGLAVVVAASTVTLWPQEFRPPPLDPSKWPQEDRCTVENFDRLQVGMTWAEVEAILGPYGVRQDRVNARARSHKPSCPNRYLGKEIVPGTDEWVKTVAWADGAGGTVLQFDRSGRLRHGIYSP